MSYQVLARKWRPRIFREMVGQEHVLQALINALDHNRLHHAYLFTGTRGVGKTTIARILAKCLNCEIGVSSEPCDQCSACVEINEGRFVDLIEVDAASRTKVEDTRELLENVQYAPSRGRYKVYLIDEVHMLSNSSFNALLKTLEEPPPHVKFLLATTDPQKLPVTILSRCLQFNLKNMNPERIVGHLNYVLEKEMIPFEEDALWQLGRSADGSMRDALSLTDQAIAFGGGKVSDADVRTMLGTIDQSLVYDVLQALHSGQGATLMGAVAKLAEHSPDYSGVLAELLAVLHRIAIAQALPEAIDNTQGDRQRIYELAQLFRSEDIQLFYQTALIGRRDLPLVPDPRSGFEMILLRMLAFKPQGVADLPKEPLVASESSSSGDNTSMAAAVVTNPEGGSDTAKKPALESDPLVDAEPSSSAPLAAPSPVPSRHTQEATGVLAHAPTDLAPAVNEHAANQTSTVLHESSAADKPADTTATGATSHEGEHEGHRESHRKKDSPVTGNIPTGSLDTTAPAPQAIVNEEYKQTANTRALVAAYDAMPAEATPTEAIPADTVIPIRSAASVSNEMAAADIPVPSEASTPIPHSAPDNTVAAANSVASIVAEPLSSIDTALPSTTTQRASATPVSSSATAPVALETLVPEQWLDVYFGLKVGGLLQSTVSNCVLAQCEAHHLLFVLDEQYGTLYDEAHQQRLAQLLSEYFAQPVTVTIELGQISGETPAACVTRRKKERQQQAEEAINHDPLVKQLQDNFGAIIVKDTIVPIDN